MVQAHARTALGKSSRNTPSLSPRHSDLSVKKKTQFTVVWPCHWTALLLEHRDLTPSQAAGTPTCPAEGPSGVQAHVPPTAHWEEVADHPRGPQGTGQEGHSISQMNMLGASGHAGPGRASPAPARARAWPDTGHSTLHPWHQCSPALTAYPWQSDHPARARRPKGPDSLPRASAECG